MLPQAARAGIAAAPFVAFVVAASVLAQQDAAFLEVVPPVAVAGVVLVVLGVVLVVLGVVLVVLVADAVAGAGGGRGGADADAVNMPGVVLAAVAATRRLPLASSGCSHPIHSFLWKGSVQPLF